MRGKKKREKNIFVTITSVYIYLMLTVFLFFVGGNGYTGIVDAKFNLFCLLCGGYVLVIVIVAAESVLVGNVKMRSPWSMLRASDWVQRLVLLYIFLTWVSALVSPYFPTTVIGATRYEGALTITIYGVCFLLVSVYGSVSKRMLWVLGVTAVLFSGLCFLQMAGGNPLGLYPDGINYADANIKYSGAYLGTIGNVDLVAAWMCLVIPILWISVLRMKGRLRFLLLIPFAVVLATLIQMNVLAGLVGVFAGGIVMIPIVAPVSPRCKKAMWIALAALATVGIVVLYTVDVGTGFLYELHELFHGRADASFGSGRIKIWKQVLQAIPSNFLFGTGPDTMAYAGLEGFSRFDEGLNAVLVAEIDMAHSEYLNVLFHQGFLALLTYMGALVLLARKWIREGPKDAVVAILGGAVWCYCIQASFGFSMCVVAPFFWLALGLLEKRCALKNVGGSKI